ncbi:hypothetical protein J437_LFUL008573 [Ladona fulva]|uniref:Uncharacterized protein n=1 Tax=Ladona fulva TaxID=123851 RepID=A0A8K0NX52_LADFU|nr:hypothetical protein J437_LFUL008573 [Ladona fulva]
MVESNLRNVKRTPKVKRWSRKEKLFYCTLNKRSPPKRFLSRRGVCSNLYSDNATTFRGAARELKAMFKKASPFYEEVDCHLNNAGTQWKFIPPYSPHFGSHVG